MPAKKQPPTPSVPDLATLADPDGARSIYHKGPTCTIATALDILPPEQAANLQKALDNPNARGIDIADALTAFDMNVAAHTVQRHRRGRCRCER